MTDHAYVTQEMWDRAQAALQAALPVIEAHTPPLSTSGTMVSLRRQVQDAIVGPLMVTEEKRYPCGCKAWGKDLPDYCSEHANSPVKA